MTQHFFTHRNQNIKKSYLLLLLFTWSSVPRLMLPATENTEEAFFFIKDPAFSPIDSRDNLRKIYLSPSKITYHLNQWEKNDWLAKIKNSFDEKNEHHKTIDKVALEHIAKDKGPGLLLTLLIYQPSIVEKETIQHYLSHLNPYSLVDLLKNMLNKNIPLKLVLPYVSDVGLRHAYYFLNKEIQQDHDYSLKEIKNIIEGLGSVPKRMVSKKTVALVKKIGQRTNDFDVKITVIDTLLNIDYKKDERLVKKLLEWLKKGKVLGNLTTSLVIIKVLKKLGEGEEVYRSLTETLNRERSKGTSSDTLIRNVLQLIARSDDPRSLLFIQEIIENEKNKRKPTDIQPKAIEALSFIKNEEVVNYLATQMEEALNEYENAIKEEIFSEDQKEKDNKETGQGTAERYEDMGSAIMIALGNIGSDKALDIITKTISLEFFRYFKLYYTVKYGLTALKKLHYQNQANKEKAKKAVEALLNDTSKNLLDLYQEAGDVIKTLKGTDQNSRTAAYFFNWESTHKKIKKKDNNSLKGIMRNSLESKITQQIASHIWLNQQSSLNLLCQEVTKKNDLTWGKFEYQDHKKEEVQECYILMKEVPISWIYIIFQKTYQVYLPIILFLLTSGLIIRQLFKKKKRKKEEYS